MNLCEVIIPILIPSARLPHRLQFDRDQGHRDQGHRDEGGLAHRDQ
jgi:hypothetical protein